MMMLSTRTPEMSRAPLVAMGASAAPGRASRLRRVAWRWRALPRPTQIALEAGASAGLSTLLVIGERLLVLHIATM